MAKKVNSAPKFHDIGATVPKYSEYSYRKGRNERFPLKTGIAAVTLFTLGTILLITGYRFGLDEDGKGTSFFILGCIAFLPGSYATTQLYGAFKGWKGYSYSQIPSYDD